MVSRQEHGEPQGGSLGQGWLEPDPESCTGLEEECGIRVHRKGSMSRQITLATVTTRGHWGRRGCFEGSLKS